MQRNPIIPLKLQDDKAVRNHALLILHYLALERKVPWWKRIFSRWHVSDEPLRHDAGSLLRQIGYDRKKPANTQYAARDQEGTYAFGRAKEEDSWTTLKNY